MEIGINEVIVNVKFKDTLAHYTKVKDDTFKVNSNLPEALKTIILKKNIPNNIGYSIFVNGQSYLKEKNKKLKSEDNIIFIPIIFGG